MGAPESFEAYLAACPDDARAALEHLRAMIRAAAPEATETISYQMPAFRAHGRMLVWMGAFRDHAASSRAASRSSRNTGTNWRATASRRGRSSSARTSPSRLRSSRRS